MLDFKVRRGLSTTLFSESGVVNPKLVIEEGSWYLCTDTADLFLGVKLEDGSYTLRRINADSFELTLTTLKQDVETLKATELFKKIQYEYELPTDFDSAEFNPNVTYYIVTGDVTAENPVVSTYIFDSTIPGYICTKGVDLSSLRSMVDETIEQVLDTKLAEKVPEVVEETIETRVLHGGNAFS